MILFKKADDLHKWIDNQHKNNKTIGFVPTMGALHPGHLSLIEASLQQADYSICSIFVNPTQFNDPADFAKYPVTIEQDLALLEAAGTDIVFLPGVEELYPDGAVSSQQYELGYLETVLDGAYRPGHFQGVCTVVERLLRIVQPDHLFLGQKDYQQCLVITRLVDIMGWQDKTIIHICPTLREKDGLAMSSRNLRLKENERAIAPILFQTLSAIQQHLVPGDLRPLQSMALQQLQAAGFRPDYVEIADAESLELLQHWDGKKKLVALAAAFLNEVRLIDNLLLHPNAE